ncbi:RNA-binding protein 41 [Alosa sapidissima]|uniref:RNA-binding protein 41 n=1 Tax=Alosa sapidissima TaxID=34773 RepID=UPI001C07FDDE|nr:RNA-binding protein 41 [Alosa sapidissima]
MKRVTRRDCDDAPVPEEQETEGQRQLHSLLLQQLDTGVDIDRCFAKKQCFAPAAFYKPFGEQAAGVKSLSQFQDLQDRETEMASLRELGLNDAEIQLWKNRDKHEASQKARGVCVDPAARRERLQVIQEKIDARDHLLSRPQRLSASRPLSRREMEIERALFQGTDRQGFLTALYHQEEEPSSDQPGSSGADTMHILYKDFLKEAEKEEPAQPASHKSAKENHWQVSQSSHSQSCHNSSQPRASVDKRAQPPSHSSQEFSYLLNVMDRCVDQPSSILDSSACQPQTQVNQKMIQISASNKKMDVSQSIGALISPTSAGSQLNGPVTVTGHVELVPEEEILKNKETAEGIRGIPRFQNYQPGEPSNVLYVKNLSPRATVAQLVSLFSRFQHSDRPPILYRLLTGRLKGQAFITLSDKESAQAALGLLHGYRLLNRPLVIEFGREKKACKEDMKEVVQPDTPT